MNITEKKKLEGNFKQLVYIQQWKMVVSESHRPTKISFNTDVGVKLTSIYI